MPRRRPRFNPLAFKSTVFDPPAFDLDSPAPRPASLPSGGAGLSLRLTPQDRDPRMRSIAAAIALLAAVPAYAQGLPPHAYLFGAWTGGLFPPPSAISPQQCLANPVVIFTRDVVMRAVITDQTYTQRQVETARTTATGTEFRFQPSPASAASVGPFNLAGPAPADVGFGCGSSQVLHVQRHGENEIVFPGCTDFPYPLIRCPGVAAPSEGAAQAASRRR
jgi:hypothetical protein